MRRKEKLLPIDRTEEILTKGDYGVLSTIGENGYPYGLPINYVYMDDCIYVHGQGKDINLIIFNIILKFLFLLWIIARLYQVNLRLIMKV